MSTSKAATIVQLVHLDETGDSCYRMRWPGQTLALQDPSLRVINLKANAEERFKLGEEADLFVVYQSNDVDLLPLIARRRAAGKKTLVEYNDNFYEPPWASPVAPHWRSPLLWQTYERFMLEADGIIVTGPGLKQLFEDRFKKPVYVLENHLPYVPVQIDRSQEFTSGEVHIGWAGSVGHVPDLLAIVPIVRELVAHHPNVHFHLMGNESLPELVGISKDRLHFTPWGNMESYFAFWNSVQIGIAPLLNTPYNRCRSDIKALEMSGSGVLPVLSKALPYEKFIQETGVPSFSTKDQLVTILNECISDYGRFSAIAKRANQFVLNNRIAKDRKERLNLYREFLSPTQNFHWAVPPGYHEIEGTPSEMNSLQLIIKEYEQLSKSGRIKEAACSLEKGLKENPFNCDLSVLVAGLLHRNGDLGSALDHIESALSLYPNDPRLAILKILLVTDEQTRKALWQTFLIHMQQSSKNYQEFCYAELSRRLFPVVRQHPHLFYMIESLQELYSGGAELRYFLAEGYLARSQFERAAEHFSWLREQKFLFSKNNSFLKGVSDNYLPAMEEGCTAILDGSFGDIN